MKTKKLITVAAVSAALAFGMAAQAKDREHQGQTINNSQVPAAVRSAAQAQAQGGIIVRWQKEGANFEAVIEKNDKQIGLQIDPSGKVLSKHDQSNSKY